MNERIRDFFLKNWSLKLTALGLSFFLWLIVRGDSGAERVITVPLHVTVPRNMEITNERPSSVDVTLRGPFNNMWFGQNIITCNIDLQGAGEGSHPVALSAENIQMPRTTGVDVVAIRPARITIVLERTTSKEVPVSPALGEPPAGYEIYSWSVFPRTVVITGPRTQVERVREVQTERVPLSNVREPFRTWVQLNITAPDIHSNQGGPLEVGVDLGPRRTTHTIAQISVVIEDETLTVTPPSISVTVLAPAVLAQALRAEDFSATVPANALEPSAESARIKPDVTLREPRGQLVVIKTVPDVVVRRAKPGADNRRRATAR